MADQSGPAARAGGCVGLAFSIAVVAMFVVMWVGFAYALLVDPDLLDRGWEWFADLPTPIAIVVWILVLPIPVGLWIWHSSWPPVVGALLALAMVAWTVIAVSSLARTLRAR